MKTRTASTLFLTAALGLSSLGVSACTQESAGQSSANMQAPASSSQQAPVADTNAQAASLTSSASSASSAADSTPAEVELRSVGSPSEGGTSFAFANKTGKAIRSLAVKATQDADFGADLLEGADAIANGDQVELLCPEVTAPDSSEGAAEADVVLRPVADIQLVLDDDTQLVLHQLNLADIDDATVRTSGNVAYLEYTSKESGSAVSTLEAEQAIADVTAQLSEEAAPVDAPAEFEGMADVAAEEPVYYEETTYYEEPVYYEEPTYVEPSYEEPTYVEPTYDDSAVGGGSEEACIDDLVLR